MKAAKRLLFPLAFLSFVAASCKTSSDIKEGYQDPTQVKTLDEEDEAKAAKPLPRNQEQLAQQLAIAQGELEELKVKQQSELGEWQKKQFQLEAENKALREEVLRLKEGAPVAAAGGETASEKSGALGLWELAWKDLHAKEYGRASGNLNEIVKTYGKDPLAVRAQLTLGMAHYNQGKYKEAAIAFNAAIDKYPKHKEIALAWLGQGAAFARLQQNEDAQLFYGEVSKRYPGSTEAKLADRWNKGGKAAAPKDLFAALPGWNEHVESPKTVKSSSRKRKAN